MKSRQADAYLASKLNRPLSEIDARLRPLRAGGHLPGGAGASAPDLSSSDFALIFLAMIGRRAVAALEVGMRAGRLRLVPPPGLKAPLGWTSDEALTFAGALVLLLDNLDIEWRALTAEDDGGGATITITRDGRPFDLHFVEDLDGVVAAVADDPARYDALGQGYGGGALVIRSGFMKSLALNHLARNLVNIAPDSPEAWNSMARALESARAVKAKVLAD